jgi:hypothetical protein
MTSFRRAALICTVMVLMAFGAANASAQTLVGNRGQGSTIEVGETLQIALKPANSGSSGYHWRVAKRPKRSVLRLASNRTEGTPARQVFTYTARAAGVTSLRLQYVSPGRDHKVARTFRHTVVVNKPVPQLDCGYPGPADLLAESATARVFKVRRTIRVYSPAARGKVVRHSYVVFMGCTAGGAAHQLGAYKASAGDFSSAGPDAGPNGLYNVTLRGSMVGYVFVAGCPFETSDTTNCTSQPPPSLAVQDLKDGKLVRGAFPTNPGPDAYNQVAGLVVSTAGGLAWTEVGSNADGPLNLVRRSDAPAEPGAAFARDVETIGSGADLDPDSLYFDGTNVEWREAGRVQRARLR